MMLTKEPYCLVLHPGIGQLTEDDQTRLLNRLHETGLLGSSFQHGGEIRFSLGESFYQLLSFMGCAPALKLAPEQPEDELFCHVRVVKVSKPSLRFLRAEVRARCPHCRKPSDSVVHIQSLYEQGQEWCCPHCQQSIVIADINWKHEAGLGQFFLELVDVHPHEVAPTTGLMNELQAITGFKWDYFYTVKNS